MFDAGAIEAELRVRLDRFDRDLNTAEAKVKRFTSQPHIVRVRPEVDSRSATTMRRQVADLDQKLATEARQRARTGHGLLGAMFGGGTGGQSAGGGLAGGLGPGILGIGGKAATLTGLGAVGLGALPALLAPLLALGVGGLGAGIAGLGAKQVIGTKKDPGPLFTQAQAAAKELQKTLKAVAAPLEGPLRQLFSQLPHILAQLAPLLKNLFGAAGTLIMPFVRGLTQLAKDVLPGLASAFRAVAPLIQPLLSGIGGLVKGLLPGLVTLLRAAMPAVRVFAQVLGMLGKDVGAMLSEFAPAIRASAVIFKALAGVIGDLLPIVGKLAGIMASVLGPLFKSFSSIIRSLEPILILVGKLIASFAAAVFKDLIAALGAAAQMIKAISPALQTMAKILMSAFNVLENSGVFAILGDALEGLVKPIAQLVNSLVRGLGPILPVIIRLIASLATTAIGVLIGVVRTILPPITMLANLLLRALAPILPPIEKAVSQVAAALGVFLLSALKALIPPVAQIIQALLQILIALLPILPPVAKLAALLVELAVKVLNATVIPVIKFLAQLLADLLTPIAKLITKIVSWATHFKQAWSDIKQWAKDAWDFLTHGWGQVLVPGITLIRLAVDFFRTHWRGVWADIRQIAADFYQWLWTDFGLKIVHFFTQTIPSAFHTAVSAIGRIWNTIKGIVTAPVKFIIDDVIDGLIRVFDWVSSKVGGPHIKEIHPFGLAMGGRIYGGSAEGADDVLARVGKNETVVSAAHSRMLAPLFAAVGVPGYAKGGVPSKQRATGGTAGPDFNPFGFVGKLGDIGKIMAAIFTGNTKALVNAFTDLTGAKRPSGAVGAMAGLLTAIPQKLISEAVHFLIGQGGISGSAPEIIRYAAQFIGKVPYVWGGETPAGWDCSGFVKWVYNHFGYSPPRTSQEQFNWAQKHPTPVPGGLAFFAGADGTQASPGHVGIVIDGFRMIDAFGTGFGTRIDKIFGSSGAISGFGVPPGGFRKSKHAPVPVGGSVVSWLRQAMSLTGRPNSWLRGLELIQHAETDDLPNKTTVVNPNGGATGLMQVKPGTYAAFATSPGGILNPVSNTVAAIRYIMSRYGNPYRIPGLGTSSYQGYDSGGWLDPGLTLAFNGTRRREAVLTHGQSKAVVSIGELADRLSRGGGSIGPPGGLMRDVHLTLPEGSTVADALNELHFMLTVARQQGYAGVMP